MARARRKDHHLPPRVYRNKAGSYMYHPPGGGSMKIAGKNASLAEVEENYKRAVDLGKPHSLRSLIELYKTTEPYQRLSAVTKTDYEQCEVAPLKVFADNNMTKIEPKHIRQYMDARGHSSRYRANRELAFLSNVCACAYERGLLRSNPCKGVKKFTEPARTHYVEDVDYYAMLHQAPLVLQVAMEIGYCTGLRITDIRKMKWADVKEGLEVTLSKTRVSMIKEITPRLQAALDAAKNLPGVSSMYVLHNRRGQMYTQSGFNALWTRHSSKIENRFQFRDIRKKAITDFEGETKQFSGHKTDQMAARYKVKPIQSPSH